ncbi:chaperonin 10-like protein [Coprinopsis sp. MPI-PUGE-AT-0042]|nr:chaperonin 10-like protein [Coprinopsis sp. MPI-PUGE-AT-0042]
MATQKAVLLPEKFGELVLGTAPIPKPGPGEVLIRVQSAGLNPVDWKMRKFGVYMLDFPVILGVNIAGDIEELGEGVDLFSKGDRVFTHGGFQNEHNAFQQFTKGDASLLAKIPSSLSYDEAASLPTAIVTAYLGLYNNPPHGLGLTSFLEVDGRGAYHDTPLIVNGGSSSVGQQVLLFAKASGFSPIITISSLRSVQTLKDLGATHVIDRHASPSSIIDEIKSVTQKPVSFVYDAVGGDDIQQALLDLLPADSGRFVYTSGLKAEAGNGKLVSHVVSIRTLPANVPHLRKLWGEAEALISEGVIKVQPTKVLPGGLKAIPDGLKLLERGQAAGSKLVVHPQEDA